MLGLGKVYQQVFLTHVCEKMKEKKNVADLPLKAYDGGQRVLVDTTGNQK